MAGSSSSSSPDPVVVAASLLVAGCAVCVGVCSCRYYLGSPSAPASSLGQAGGDKTKAKLKAQHDKGTTYESVEMDVFKDDPQVSVVYCCTRVYFLLLVGVQPEALSGQVGQGWGQLCP